MSSEAASTVGTERRANAAMKTRSRVMRYMRLRSTREKVIDLVVPAERWARKCPFAKRCTIGANASQSSGLARDASELRRQRTRVHDDERLRRARERDVEARRRARASAAGRARSRRAR